VKLALRSSRDGIVVFATFFFFCLAKYLKDASESQHAALVGTYRWQPGCRQRAHCGAPLDHFASDREQSVGESETKQFSGLQTDDQPESSLLHDR